MTVSLRIEPSLAPAFELAHAMYFNSGDRSLFGWLHHPRPGSVTRTGLVICQPFGYEAICAHRSVRAFAEAAAALGMPTLRFDYSGTGDSADIDPRADQLEVWSRDVMAAVAELQSRTGVDQVCLLGFRLGAVLAALAANLCKSVSALILVAPVVSGRRYIRELRTMRLVASLETEPKEMARKSTDDASMEVGGFSLSEATIEALTQIELTTLAAPRVAEILVIDRNDLPTARTWTEAVSGFGIRAQYLTLPGFVEMMLTAPQFAVVPQAMIGAMSDWLVRFESESFGRAASANEPRPDDAAAETSTSLSLASAAAGGRTALTERPVRFGSNAVLFGIVTEPSEDQKRRGAVVLLNSGADHHIGASRMYVSLARRWAQSGYVVLRMDLAGLGDSGTRLGQTDNDVFPPAALEDIRDAIEYMRTRYGAGDMTLGGLCSGAYHSLRAAVAGLPVNRILMVNPQNFFWKQGDTLEDLQLAEVVRNPVVYRERVFSVLAWKRLVSGRVNVWRLVAVFIHRVILALESTLRDLARHLGIRLPRDLGCELEGIAAQGIDAIFVFAPGDPGIGLLKLQAGSSLGRLGNRLRVHIIDGADHNFSHRGPRALMERVLSDELIDQNQRTGAVSTRSTSSPIPQAQVHKLGSP